jgi:hypothetical protein
LNIRLSIGGFKSSTIESIYVTANEPPLWIRRIKITLTISAKLKKNDLEALILKYVIQITKIYQINHSNIIKYETIQTSPWSSKINLNTELEKYKKSKTDPSIFLNLFWDIKNNLPGEEIYTDASKSEHGVGIAVITNNENISLNLSNQNSIYTAEALTILTDLKYINNNLIQ